MGKKALTVNWLGHGAIGFGLQMYPAGSVVVSCVQSWGPQGVPVLKATGSVPAINQWLQQTLTCGSQLLASAVIMEARRRGRLENV